MSEGLSPVNPGALIAELERLGVQLWEESGELRFRAPRGVFTDERREALRENKAAVVQALRRLREQPAVTAGEEQRHDPFPLTDVQAAYLLGRHDAFA